MSKREIFSSNRRANLLLYVALGAIFLFAVGAVGSLVFGSPRVRPAMLPTSAREAAFTQLSAADSIVMPGAPELVFVGKTSVLATAPPVTVTPKVLGAIIGGSATELHSTNDVTHYVAEEGDTVSSLAERFGVSQNTILWANDLNSGSALTPGQELLILPVSGALHLVRQNDTLSEIASWYRGDIEDIKEFNNLDDEGDIFAGDFLIIPNGTMPKSLPRGRLTPIASSYFIYPVPRDSVMTQGLHPYNAVDLSNGKCNQPVYAAAGGTIQKTGYQSVAGNYVRILHPNGVVTFYGHLTSQTVSPGERVFQGQIIGYTGHTGYTIPAGPGGCHLHFEVRGATNPFIK